MLVMAVCFNPVGENNDDIPDKLKLLQSKLVILEKDTKLQSYYAECNESLIVKSSKDYHIEVSELKQQIFKIRSKVLFLKNCLFEKSEFTSSSSISDIKKELEEIEMLILTFKGKQKEIYEILLNDERIIWQELLCFKRQLETFTIKDDNLVMPCPPAKGQLYDWNEMNTSAPSAVKGFQEYLYKNGGHTGGWEEHDHHVFVKLWASHKEKNKFLQECVKKIPAHALLEIEKHSDWYSKYLIFSQDNKQLIAEWKKLKEAEKKRLLTKVENEQKDVQSSVKCLSLTVEDKKLQIAKWKEHKRKIKECEEEEVKVKMDREIAKRKRQEEGRKMQLKIQIEQYNKQRDQQRTKAAELHEVEKLKLKQNAKLANKQIQKFQSRDNELLQAKKQLLQKNLQGKNKKNVWLERIKEKVIVEHNPERVYQLTTTWKERQKSAQNIKTSPVSIEIPRKAIPAWRQGL